ncbi:hypothetical protein FOG18_03135 [Legionella israelensis]|uniref:hypothetical protein n=1 Tax=Legionella israelensis TaxID=454 RepID=UPI00117E8487|nr:hypothetical protein [Legionella israelensis]QDP71639.1 hypothetical protein FOG18_03135 [Legionella israelensis]
MSVSNQNLEQLIKQMAVLLDKNDAPDPNLYASFIQEPELSFKLVDFINDLSEEQSPQNINLYSAAIFALDLCVAQLQSTIELQYKPSMKTLERLMNYMAEIMNRRNHSVSFWLPALNAFYETHTELTSALKNAYFNLASEEEDASDYDDFSHIHSMKNLIAELSDLSVFDITENFFAQSYAMPSDFFADLVIDLYSIEEGQDIGLLTLLHPKKEVRDMIIATMDQFIDDIVLSPISLSRLEALKHWFPEKTQLRFSHWIKIQRKKGVVFAKEKQAEKTEIKVSEVDGSGSQGVFIHYKKNRKNRLCGLLFSLQTGIKDAWITPDITAADVKRYYHEAFDDTVTLRPVGLDYLKQMCEHFLALTIAKGNIPDLHLLEIQELLGLQFHPKQIDVEDLIEELGIQITPFTPENLENSLKRSKSWSKNKRFTESWFVENAHIDKLVNRHCSIIEGTKVCNFDEAMKDVFKEEMEVQRERWLFHFIWLTLWLKSSARKNEKIWQDSFYIAYAINQGRSLDSIPIMRDICYQSVTNSVETMQERRTHLTQE